MSKAAEATTAQEKPTEAKGIRNFRTLPEVEQFYRFINENNIRREAKIILEYIHTKFLKKKAKKTRKSRSKKVQ